MNPLEEMIEASMDSSLSQEEKQKYKSIFMQIFIDGKTPSEVLGFDKDMIEHMYAYGFRLYNLGDYKKAVNVFLGLTMFDQTDPRFSLAAGAAYHKLKNVVKAVDYYYQSSLEDPDYPMPHFFMYDCFMQQDLWGDAAFCLEEVIKRCGDHSEYNELKARCKLLLEPLKVKIGEFEAKLEKSNEQQEKSA